MKILVINQNEDAKYLPYTEQYQLFSSWKTAVTAAKKIGWRDDFGMGINTKVGIANQYRCDPVNVSILALEEQ